jgi:hypothetical protein
VKDLLIVACNGNFQHCHQKDASKSHLPLVTPEMFVEASDLEYVLKYTAKQEKTHKV